MAFAGEAYFEDLQVTNFSVVPNETTGSNFVTGLPPPVEPTDATNKVYVDDLANSADSKDSCYVATTENLNCVYDLDEQTLTSTQNAIIIIDGITPPVDSRVLVKNQTNRSDNGIYVVNEIGGVNSVFVLQRSADANSDETLQPGAFTFIENGFSNKGKGFVFVCPDLNFVFGVSEVNFNQFSGTNFFEPSDGIFLNAGDNNKLSVVGTPNRISVSSAGVDIAANYEGQNSIRTVGTLTSGSIEGSGGNFKIDATPIGSLNPSTGHFTNTAVENLVVSDSANFFGDSQFSSLQISSVKFDPRVVTNGEIIGSSNSLNIATPLANTTISVIAPTTGLSAGKVLYFMNTSTNVESQYTIDFGSEMLVGPGSKQPVYYQRITLGPAMSTQVMYNGEKWFLMNSGAILS